ncbi:amino acid ABC transporter substrate-binding protein [Desulfothermus okinawensis JCM 13304]
MKRVSIILGILICFVISFGPVRGVFAKSKIIIGFTTSQTGKLNAESKEQFNGLELWKKYVNKNGGIYVKNLHRKFPVEFRYYDDESSKDRVQQLYVRLINQDKADFLVSPYSSGLTASSAIIAEQYEKVMLATGAASDSIFSKGYSHVFQIYTPASRYLTGALDLLKTTDPKAKKIAIIFEQSNFAKAVATAAKNYAEKLGYKVVIFESYGKGTTDFTSFLNKIAEKKPDAIIGGGHFADGETFAKQIFEQKIQVKLVSLLVAPAVPKFAEIGKAALYVTAPSQWEPKAKFTKNTAKKLGIKWYGVSGDWFIKNYAKLYGETPGYHAAGGFAAGLVLQKAIEDAGCLKSSKVIGALEKMDIMTFYGRIKFDRGDYYGRQIGHEMVYLQWQNKGGKLVKQVIWPKGAESANLIYPYSKKF